MKEENIDFLKCVNNLKKEIKEFLDKEECLKSISFSIVENENKFIIYYAWNKENYNKYDSERYFIRNYVINLLKSYYFLYNIKESNPAKQIFVLKIIG